MAKINTAAGKAVSKPGEAAKPARRSGERRSLLRSFRRYLLESWHELLKVNWPTWREVSRFTGLVLFVLMVLAILIYVLDKIFTYLSKYLFGL